MIYAALRRRRYGYPFLAMAMACTLATDFADAQSQKTLRTMDEMTEYFRKPGVERMDVDFVTSVNYWNAERRKLFVQDGFQALYVRLPKKDYLDPPDLRAGTRIRVIGELLCQSCTLRASEIRIVEHSTPVTALKVNLSSLGIGNHWSRRIRFTGTVTAAVTMRGLTRLTVNSKDTLITCFVDQDQRPNQIGSAFVGAKVDVTGVLEWRTNASGVPIQPICQVASREDITRLTDPNPIPPALTLKHIGDLDSTEIGATVEVAGIVGFYEPGKHFFLEDEFGSIVVRDNGFELIQPGQNVLVRGIVRQLGESKQLLLQTARDSGRRHWYPDAVEVDAHQLLLERMNHQRIAIAGKLTRIDSRDYRREMTLRNRSISFQVIFNTPNEHFDELKLQTGQLVHCRGLATLSENRESNSTGWFTVYVSDPKDIWVERDGIHLDSVEAKRWLAGFAAFALAAGLWLVALKAQVRRKTEHLSGLTARLNATYETIDEGLIILDPDDRILSVNQRFSELTGANLPVGTEATEVLQHLKSRYQSSDDFLFFDLATNVTKTAKLRSDNQQFVANMAPVFKNGSKIAKLFTLRDVTEQKALKAKLIQSQKMDAVGRLAGGIAHDFNNLLMVMMTNIELAQSSHDSKEELDKSLSSASFAADRAALLVRNLLGFSRQSAASPKTLSLNPIVEQVCSLIQHSFESTIEIDVQLDPDLWLAKVDPTQIEQVLMNLCLNARDAIPNHTGRILVTTNNVKNENGEFVQLSVSDNGEGMPHEVRERMFDPFFTTKPIGQGTGLGLSMSYGIVKQLGGSIECDSTPGFGSTLDVSLPRCEADHHVEPPTPIPSDARFSGHILVVDDDDNVRRCTVKLLEKIGFQVHDVDNGIDALELLEQHEFDLILLDLNMPRMSGREVFKQLSIKKPALPVIICTGYLFKREDFAAETGAKPAAFLGKPFGSAELQSTITKALPCSTAAGTALKTK